MSAGFNRDVQLLVTTVPLPHGYRVFLLDGSDCELLHCHRGKKIFLIGCLEMEMLVGYIVLKNNRKQLLICDLENDKILQSKEYNSDILAVKKSPKTIVVLMQDQIFIHNDIENIMMGRYIHVPRNPKGIGALAEKAPYFAYPCFNNTENMSMVTLNSVQIMDVSEHGYRVISTIYQNSLPKIAAIVLNKTGELIAITNTEGKLIRLFAVNSGQMIIEYYRGYTPAAIDLLYISGCEKYLVSISDSKTVHIFRIKITPPEQSLSERLVKMLPPRAQELASGFFNTTSFAKAYLIMEQGGSGCVCGMKAVGKQTRLLVASTNNYFHVYILPRRKGTCRHVDSFNLRFRNREELDTVPTRDQIQIGYSTKSESLMSRAAARVKSKFTGYASTFSAVAPAPTSADLDLEAGPSTSAAAASASFARSSTFATESSTSTSTSDSSVLAASTSTSSGATVMTYYSDDEEETRL